MGIVDIVQVRARDQLIGILWIDTNGRLVGRVVCADKDVWVLGEKELGKGPKKRDRGYFFHRAVKVGHSAKSVGPDLRLSQC